MRFPQLRLQLWQGRDQRSAGGGSGAVPSASVMRFWSAGERKWSSMETLWYDVGIELVHA
jgi:hypothetical protein